MESNDRDAKIKPIMDDMGPQKEAKEEVFDKEGDDMDMDMDMDTQLLLPTKNGGGVSKGPTKSKRKVHWNDSNGNKLAQVLEFVPSDASDSDDDDADTCFCTIM